MTLKTRLISQFTDRHLFRERRRLLRFGSAAIALATVGAINGCHRNSTTRGYRIAVALQGMTAEFMQLWLRSAQAHPAFHTGLATLTVFDGRLDAFTQATQFDMIVTQRFDAVIFIPVDAEAGLGPAEQAKAAGIPLIGSNTLLSNRTLYARYIGSDDIQGGKEVATAVVGRIDGRGNVVILEGPIGHSAQIQRREGINAVLAHSPQVRVLETKSANWSRAEALALMENWLTAHDGNIRGVIAQNDEMALGAIEAVKARGLDPANLPIAGIDGIADALKAVKRGEMSTTLQDANAQAQGAIDLALRTLIGPTFRPMSRIWKQYGSALAWGDGAQSQYMVPWTPVTGENVDRFLALRQGV